MQETFRSERAAAMHSALHDLCQPLTALQCRLEMGRLAASGDGLREAVDGGLEETRRLFVAVARLRRCLLEAEAGGLVMMDAVEGGGRVH